MVRTERLAAAFETERIVADGEYIVRDGELGQDMFLVREGTVVISKEVNGRVVVLDELGKGDFFGEMSLLESLPRDADARARGQARLRVLGPGALLVRLRQDPSFGLEMLHRLSGRVRSLNGQLSEALDGAPHPFDPAP